MKINFNGKRLSVIRWNNREDDNLNEAVLSDSSKQRCVVLLKDLTANQVRRIKCWPAFVNITIDA